MDIKSLKIFLLLILALFFLSGSVTAEEKDIVSPEYQADRTYAGHYPADGLYMRRSSQKAYVPHYALAHLDQVNCNDARRSLAEYGQWQGNLKASGTCGDPAEPASWVLGNYLNYMTDR